MAHCAWCGNRGLILRVDNSNLCQGCQQQVYPDIKAKTELVLRCYKQLKETEVLKLKLSLLNTLLSGIEELRKYEAKHIPTPDIEIDLNRILANTTDASLVEIKIDTHKKEAEEERTIMDEYVSKYGKLPQEIYAMALEETAGYLKVVMERYEKSGINTLSEIEGAIKERRPFVGPHARGTLEDGHCKVYVAGDLIYDGKEGIFDYEWKRLQIYSEIQHMVATHIFGKDLKTIRKESRKRQKE